MAYIARNHKWHSECLLSSLVHDAFYRWGMWRHGEGVIQESNMGYNTAYSSLNILEDNGCTSADSTAMPAQVITGFEQTLPVRRQFLKQQKQTPDCLSRDRISFWAAQISTAVSCATASCIPIRAGRGQGLIVVQFRSEDSCHATELHNSQRLANTCLC